MGQMERHEKEGTKRCTHAIALMASAMDLFNNNNNNSSSSNNNNRDLCVCKTSLN
jgi:hypothetical protein